MPRRNCFLDLVPLNAEVKLIPSSLRIIRIVRVLASLNVLETFSPEERRAVLLARLFIVAARRFVETLPLSRSREFVLSFVDYSRFQGILSIVLLYCIRFCEDRLFVERTKYFRIKCRSFLFHVLFITTLSLIEC